MRVHVIDTRCDKEGEEETIGVSKRFFRLPTFQQATILELIALNGVT